MKRSLGLCALCLAAACSLMPAAEPAGPSRGWLPVPELKPNPRIPTLKKVVGHDWGRDITSYVQLERYLKILAKEAHDRLVLVPYGKTYEGRTLYYLLISSPENLRRREAIRADNLLLSDPRQTPADKARALISRTPTIVWLGFNVHGNETSCAEAALLTAYHLLADQRPSTSALLKQVVVIIDPLQNPDGRERFVSVFRETRGVFPDSQPLAAEHQERWPGGRFNHYLFDMNRDWFLQSQRETQAKVAAYLHWQPHLLVDAHEMGADATYFFDPPADPVNPFFLPRQSHWIEQLGRHLAARFDACGFAYTTREMFDSFYPGYGSTWPIFQGGLGILWEQAGVRGLSIKREDQTLLRLEDAIRHHYTSALATVEFAAQHRAELVGDFYQARARGVQLGQEGPVGHYFLPRDPRTARVTSLARLLRNNGVEVRRLTEACRVTCTNLRTSQQTKVTIPAGSFHIPVAQPAGHLVRVLLDRHVDMGKEFVERQLERNKERFPDEIYDVTAWSLPCAFDVECLSAPASAQVTSAAWDGDLPAGEIAGGKAQVAYLVADHDSALTALASWLRQGLRVHVADRPMEIGDEEFPRGTLILRTNDNPPDLHSVLERSARQWSLRVVACQSGLAAAGAHLGGPYVRWVRPPKIAMLVDRPASYSVGHTWYLFDQNLQYPVTRVAGRNLSRLDLPNYNVLVLPDGGYGDQESPTEEDARRIRQWVSEGGTLILVKGAAAWATKKTVGLLPVALRKKPAESPAAAKDAPDKSQPDSSDQANLEPPDPAPGVFLRAKVFGEHWTTFGYSDEVDVFFNGNVVLTAPPLSKGRSLVTFLPVAHLQASGFCWPQTLELLAESSYMVYQSVGQGHIVAFADDPNFRAMYPSLQRLFVNAVMFGPGH